MSLVPWKGSLVLIIFLPFSFYDGSGEEKNVGFGSFSNMSLLLGPNM